MSDWYSRAREEDGRTDDEILGALAYEADGDEPPRRLPKAPKAPETRSLESFDRERVICVHELARAMEEFATKEPVQMYSGSIEFEEAAAKVLELAGISPKCGLKGR